MKHEHLCRPAPMQIGEERSDFRSRSAKLYAGCCCCCCCCLFWVGGVIGAVIGRNIASKGTDGVRNKVRDDAQYIRAVYWFWIVFIVSIGMSFLTFIFASDIFEGNSWASDMYQEMSQINAVVLGGFFPVPHVIFSMIACWVSSVFIEDLDNRKLLRRKLWGILGGAVVGYLAGASIFLPFIFS